MKDLHLWIISWVCTAVLTSLLLLQWSAMNRYDPLDTGVYGADIKTDSRQLVDPSTVDRFLESGWAKSKESETSEMLKVPTGLFIQSLKFLNAAEVNITGYVWQRYADDFPERFKPDLEEGEVGVVFPEQVDTADPPSLAYTSTYTPVRDPSGRGCQIDPPPSGEVMGWYFEATLRQPFEYGSYPFDHKTVWVRMWPKDFNENIVLVPDFWSYDCRTGIEDKFGIERNIVLGAWERSDTFFSYRSYSYTTNFGLPFIGLNDFPELHYNFVLERKFMNALIVYLFPLFVVAALLFGGILTFTTDASLADRHGLNTSGVIAASSALFFVVLLAHVQLRQQFAGSGVISIEQFYLLIYPLLVLVAAFGYVMAKRNGVRPRWLLARDGLLVKLAYWPLVVGAMNAVTFWWLR